MLMGSLLGLELQEPWPIAEPELTLRSLDPDLDFPGQRSSAYASGIIRQRESSP